MHDASRWEKEAVEDVVRRAEAGGGLVGGWWGRHSSTRCGEIIDTALLVSWDPVLEQQCFGGVTGCHDAFLILHHVIFLPLSKFLPVCTFLQLVD